MNEEQYPECEKLRQAFEISQQQGEFIEWLETQGIFLASWDFDERTVESILADFHKIDLRLVEKERRQILKNLNA